MSNYTDEDILRFLYDEMSEEENSGFLSDLYSDEKLWERYELFQEAAEQAAGIRFEPSEQVIEALEAFARTVPVNAEFARAEAEEFAPAAKPQPFSLANTIIMAVCALLIGSGLAFLTPTPLETSPSLAASQQVTSPALAAGIVSSPLADPVVHWDDSQLDQQIDILWEGISKLKAEYPPML